MARQITQKSPSPPQRPPRRPERSPYSEQAPHERAAARAAVRREEGPLTRRVRAVLAEPEERWADPGDLPELEAATPSQFMRAVLEATEAARVPSQVPSTLRGTAPPSSRRPGSIRGAARAPEHVERAVEEELVLPSRPRPYREALAECGGQIAMTAIRRAGGNKSLAARELELTREGLYDVLRRAGLR